MNNLLPHVKKGLDYLYEIRTPEGSFPDSIYFIKEKKWNSTPATIFSTALITHALMNIRQNAGSIDTDICRKCNTLINKSLGFFISEMEMPGLWHFGTRSDKRWNSLPPDIDDTCCVSYLLKNYHPYIYFGMNKPLILKNRNDGGLFFTWIKSGDNSMTNDIDSIVNVNALLYIGESDSTKNTIDYIVKLIRSNTEKDSYYYYTDDLCLYYMISRTFASGITNFIDCREPVFERLLTRENYNILYSAMALCILFNFNYAGTYPSRLKSCILDAQSTDGSWEKYPFYQGEIYPHPAAVMFGSKALTTAICLEALSGLGIR